MTLGAHNSRARPSRAFNRVDEQSESAAWDRQPLQHGSQGRAREAQADSSDADDAAGIAQLEKGHCPPADVRILNEWRINYEKAIPENIGEQRLRRVGFVDDLTRGRRRC